ncbi:hypothetical protein L226DRAFT_331294 [Lentinus tigrinus ALCF2SS1-7]|uniref:uncharacterized protein n=1 Tax=Lentinus tigrinus ALCF2SS1-7 TaxID=1328758 RepID=UPI001165D50C|nr:hypothetical protein L226DRAFT_331294 [Lentinus tigrinus ALCF2SS1-7]
MPSFATAVVTEDSADSVRVALNARFILVAGSPSDTVYALKGRVPDGIDVVLHSDLVITISGTMDRARVDSRAIQSSAIAQHLQNYFHVNGEQLGVRIASRIFVDDDDDGKVKITLSPTRPVLERCSPFVRLSAIELVYACKKPPTPHAYALPQSGSLGDQDAAADPFSPHGFLPLVAALDRIVDKFAVLHLVKKYPLIFGPWRERFDAEVAVSRKVVRTITDIVARSPHTLFRKRCHRLIKVLLGVVTTVPALTFFDTQTIHKNAVHTSRASADSLRTLLSDVVAGEDKDELDDLAGDEGLYASSDHCDVLCQAMERLLRCGVKPTRYKGTAAAGLGQGKGHDDDFQLSDCRPTSPMTFDPQWDDHGQVARDRVELRFDEDTETVDGSQDRDVLFDGSSDLDDVDLWVSDEAESFHAISPPLEDVDDLWGSSQSTLDVCILPPSSGLLIIDVYSRTPSRTRRLMHSGLHSHLLPTPRSPIPTRGSWSTCTLTRKKTAVLSTISLLPLLPRINSTVLPARHPMHSRKRSAHRIPCRPLVIARVKVFSNPLLLWTCLRVRPRRRLGSNLMTCALRLSAPLSTKL